MDLKGKAAIVTGSSTGIGRAISLALAARGCDVAVNFTRSEEQALQTVADIEKCAARAFASRADVSQDADCARLVTETVARFGRLDVLVNNAGATAFVPHANLKDLTPDVWDHIFAVNVRGAFQMARAAETHLRASGSGAIVNVSSAAGISGGGSSIPYAASKAALNNLTISLARVLAPEVRVNCVAPGFTDTRWLAEGYGERLAAMRSYVKQQTPLRGTGQPEHIAQAVVSMIADMDWVTGEILLVDGGFMKRSP